MGGSANLTNQFLIAMPGLRDPNFARTVTYICEHSDKGAMGIVVNRPLEISFDDIFEHLELEGFDHHHAQRVLSGGSVQTDRGFVLHRWTGRRSGRRPGRGGEDRDIAEAMTR